MASRAVPAVLIVTALVSAWTVAAPAAYAAGTVFDVQVSWADAGRAAVRVTWNETSPQPNHLRVVTADGTLTAEHLTAADDANTIDLPYRDFLRRPADPLDVPRVPRFAVYKGPANGYEVFVPLGPAAPGTSFTLPRPQERSFALVVAETGPWSGPSGSPEPFPQAQVNGTGLVPAARSGAAYGSRMALTGTVRTDTTFCDHGILCSPIDEPDAGHRIVVQARRDASSLWQAVGSGVSTAGTTTTVWSPYSVEVGVPGTRQYRVVAVNVDSGIRLQTGTASAPMTIRAVTRVMSAKFLDPVVVAGARATASLWVRPEGRQRATLQHYVDGSWRSLKWVYLKGGRGSYAFTGTRRSSTSYRFVVPATTSDGYGVDGVATRPFALTVR